MKKIYFILTILFFVTTNQAIAQNDSIYFWKNGVMIHKQSIKTADLDSITFRRPVNLTGINIPGPNVTDIDGNTYQSVSNCSLTFTKQNLNVSKYTDGTTIPQVQDPTQWANLTTGAWCYYNNDPANGAVYGKLYNWYAVAGIYDAASAANPALRKKLAPNGWHVPTDTEWSNLINCLDPNADGGNNINIAGSKMKAIGNTYVGNGLWTGNSNGDATNESGFKGLPGGFRIIGAYDTIGYNGNWWSSSETSDIGGVWFCNLFGDIESARKMTITKFCGLSVRCVKD